MARYGQKFKERVVARLLPPESSPVEAVSHTVGISVGTLERWRAEVLADPAGAGVRHWTPAARLEALIATAAMDQSARSAWCREHGVYPTELETWKQDAIGGLGEPRESESAEVKQDRRRIKELERELHRKDKACPCEGGGRWPKRPLCSCYQKNCMRSSTKTRAHDPSGRSPDPD